MCIRDRGKARPCMLFGQVGVSLCLFLLFAIPAGSTTMQYIYFFIVYTALNAVFYTANGIAYSSLVALITKNNNERVQLGSFRFMFAVVTNIFMGFAVTGMVEKFGSGAAGWRTTALIFAIVGLVVNTISCLAVKELPEEELSGNTSEAAEEGKAVAEEKKHGFAETAKILVHNKYYLMILAIYIVYYIMSNLTTGAGVFCATYYWGDGSLLGQFSMMKMFPVIIALAFAPVLIKKTGSMQKVNFWGYAISSVLGIPMIYFAMQKNLSMFLLFMFIKGVFAGTLSGSLNALIAEASGYTTRPTGVHMDGMMSVSYTHLRSETWSPWASSKLIWFRSACSHISMTATRRCRSMAEVQRCFLPASQSHGLSMKGCRSTVRTRKLPMTMWTWMFPALL